MKNYEECATCENLIGCTHIKEKAESCIFYKEYKNEGGFKARTGKVDSSNNC